MTLHGVIRPLAEAARIEVCSGAFKEVMVVSVRWQSEEQVCLNALRPLHERAPVVACAHFTRTRAPVAEPRRSIPLDRLRQSLPNEGVVDSFLQ